MKPVTFDAISAGVLLFFITSAVMVRADSSQNAAASRPSAQAAAETAKELAELDEQLSSLPANSPERASLAARAMELRHLLGDAGDGRESSTMHAVPAGPSPTSSVLASQLQHYSVNTDNGSGGSEESFGASMWFLDQTDPTIRACFEAAVHGNYEEFVANLPKNRNLALLIPVAPADNRYAVTLLHAAAAGGNSEIVKLIIEKGAKANAQSRRCKFTPLYNAVIGNNAIGALTEQKKLRTARVLLDAGADVNAAGILGTPLHAAARYGSVPLIDMLLDAGARADAVDELGNTPLHFAGTFAAAERLIQAGANVNVQNKNGVTPLHVAASLLDVEQIKLLLANGADPKLCTTRRATAYAWAAMSDGQTHADPADNWHFIEQYSESEARRAAPSELVHRRSTEVGRKREIASLLLSFGANLSGPIDAQYAIDAEPMNPEPLEAMKQKYRRAAQPRTAIKSSNKVADGAEASRTNSDERLANALLAAAAAYESGGYPDVARQRYQEVLKTYSKTVAARTAQAHLMVSATPSGAPSVSASGDAIRPVRVSAADGESSASQLITKIKCVNNGVSQPPIDDVRVIRSNGGKTQLYSAGDMSVAKELWGRHDVFCLHPKSPTIPCHMDLSAITADGRGALHLHFHAFPTGQCEVVVSVGKQVWRTIKVAGNDWIPVSVPFRDQAVSVDVRAIGWWNEHAFITLELTDGSEAKTDGASPQPSATK